LGRDINTVDGHLRALDFLCGVLAVGTLIKFFRYNLDTTRYFPNSFFDFQSALTFAREEGLSLLLLGCVLAIYYISRKSVTFELEVARKMFMPSRMPREWSDVQGGREAVKLVMIFMASYVAIAFFIDWIAVVSAGFIAIFIVNAINMRMQRRTLRKYFSMPSLMPLPAYEHHEFIIRRREVAEKYIFETPHLLKEYCALSGCCLSFVLALAGFATDTKAVLVLAQVILLVTLIGNELTVFLWRRSRNRRLNAIDDDEAVADGRRGGPE
jgi:hypothetical protein